MPFPRNPHIPKLRGYLERKLRRGLCVAVQNKRIATLPGTAPDVEGCRIADFASATFLLSAAGLTKPVHFVPDSTLISNNFRFSKNYGSTAVAAGYGLSVLEQDSCAQIQQTAGYNVGKITTNSAYLNITSNALKGVGLEGFVKYNNRDNDSTFPAGTLLNATHGERLAVRIDQIKASYVYEYNKDTSYSALTGGYHTLMMGVGFGF